MADLPVLCDGLEGEEHHAPQVDELRKVHRGGGDLPDYFGCSVQYHQFAYHGRDRQDKGNRHLA